MSDILTDIGNTMQEGNEAVIAEAEELAGLEPEDTLVGVLHVAQKGSIVETQNASMMKAANQMINLPKNAANQIGR